jgi:hypothetical protein
MAAELDQLHQMLQNVGKSMEAQDMERKDYEARIKAFDAETKRISAVQSGMSEQQIQDIAMGVVAAAMESQSMLMPEMREEPAPIDMMPEQMMPQQGMMQ